MKTIYNRRIRFGLAAIAVTLLGFGSFTAPAVSAETYSSPTAPSKVTTIAAEGGFRVFWKAVTANPPVSYYIVSAGVGSCPVIVPSSDKSAFMYALNDDTVTVTVQAVSDYGVSTGTSSGAALAPLSKTSLPLKSVQLLQLSDFHGQLEANRSFGGKSSGPEFRCRPRQQRSDICNGKRVTRLAQLHRSAASSLSYQQSRPSTRWDSMLPHSVTTSTIAH